MRLNLGHKSLAKKPVGTMRQAVRILLGVSVNASDSRRLWPFRLVIGAILMCFGLLFLDTTDIAGPEYVIPGISVAMISGGAFIACGFLTRLVSFTPGITCYCSHSIFLLLQWPGMQ